MIKLKAPGLSPDASGSLADALTFSTAKGRAYAKKHAAPKQPRTQAQLAVQTMTGFLAHEWKNLSPADHATWSARANLTRIYPYHAYIAANAKRWHNFRSPSKQDPATEATPPIDNGLWHATVGYRQVTLDFYNYPSPNYWACCFYRWSNTPYIPSLDQIIIIKAADPGTYTYAKDAYLQPGVYRYMHNYISIDGLMGSNTDVKIRTVT